MKNILIAVALLLGGVHAGAAEAPAWVCSMDFEGNARGVKLLVGYYHFNGTGELKCVSLSGQKASYPIKVTMEAAPLSPTISLSRMRLTGVAADISLFSTNPADILGTYIVAQGSAAVFGGVGIITAVRADLPSMTLKLSLQFAKGFGINLGLNKMKVELDHSRL